MITVYRREAETGLAAIERWPVEAIGSGSLYGPLIAAALIFAKSPGARSLTFSTRIDSQSA
jgi:hypothetical protein